MPQSGRGDRKVQAYNYRLCLTDSVANQIPLSRPEGYDSTHYELLLRTIQQRDQAGWKQVIEQLYLRIMPIPHRKTDVNNKGGFSTDLVGGSYAYPEATYAQRDSIALLHRRHIEGLLYFLAHDSRVTAEIRSQMQKWGWPKDEFTDNNGFPHQLYVREARRMIGQTVMTEHHCMSDTTAPDGIALAAYNRDSHNCDRLLINGEARNEGDVQEPVPHPYPVAYSSLVPKMSEAENVLVPVCLSASHIAYGSIRMEPVFMVTAQAAAMAAAMAINNQKAVQQINMSALQNRLKNDPLLNGSRPEIIIDNEQEENVTITGNWKKIAYRNAAQNLNDFLLAEGGKEQAEAIFSSQVEEGGEYNVYLYCPSGKIADKEKVRYSTKLPVTIAFGEVKETIVVNQQQHPKQWAFLGKYSFTAGVPIKVIIKAGGLQEAAAADAILIRKADR